MLFLFSDKTTSRSEYTGETTERVTPIRRNTWTKIEGEMNTSTTSTSEYVNHSANIEKTTIIKKATDNLKTEGETNFTTTNMSDYTENQVTYMRPRQRTWTKDDFDKFYQQVDEKRTTTSQDMYTNITQTTDMKQTVIKHEDNLKMQGTFYTPEKIEYTPSERPTAVRPSDNLKPEGKFERPVKDVVGQSEKRTPIRHQDNLQPEGEFERPQKQKYQPADIPKGGEFFNI